MLMELAEKYGSTSFKEAPEITLFAHNMTYDGSFMLKYLMNLQILLLLNIILLVALFVFIFASEPSS